MPKKTKKTAEAEPGQPEPIKGSLEIIEVTAQESELEAKPRKPKAAKAEKSAPAPKKAAAKKSPAKKPVKGSAKAAAPAAPEAELPVKAESPAVPEPGAAEAGAQAADTFEAAIEPNDPREVQPVQMQPVEETHPAPSSDAAEVESGEDEDEEEQFEPAPRPPEKLERLQKILAQAGVASRRHAEELITQGRVQVNGKIVTELGSKADRNRDHIRVDGKLLHGAERQRYFVLNKPRGFVTTVSDPEGRPTVMQFFAKMNERLYPVGRLDYLSEGLLLVTNDGDLANKLTKAASGVEKTYLVKVSGQPTEEQLDSLREGISIDRGKPGEGRVRTSAARIRQVRVGDNPWYEVVLIEGRNRELRKMFEEIGHFVEKIRRVGYGPLILDQEPGNLRELDEQELKMLRLAADGKWKPKRIKSTAMLPAQAGRTVDPEATRTRPGKPFLKVRNQETDRGSDRGTGRGSDRGANRGPGRQPSYPPDRGTQGAPLGRRPENLPGGLGRGPAAGSGGTGQDRPRFQKPGFAPRSDDRDRRRSAGSTFGRPQPGGERRPFTRPPADRGEGRSFTKPPVNRGESRGFSKPPADRGGERRSFSRPPAGGTGQRPFREHPAAGGADKPRFERPAFPSRPRRAEGAGFRAEGAGFEQRKPFKPRPSRPVDRPAGGQSGGQSRGQSGDRRFGPRPGKPAGGGFSGERSRPPQGAGRSFGPRPEGRTGDKPAFPPRREGGPPFRGTARPPASGRAAFTSTGIPRPGGARPSSGGAGKTGFQGRGPGSASGSGGARPGGGRPGGSRPGSNGSSRPGFKGKPGGRSGKPGAGPGRKRL
jgi:23S rRNA pseudouridine2605 synthase